MRDVDVGVVVTYHDQPETILECLCSLSLQGRAHIVLVDDGSAQPLPWGAAEIPHGYHRLERNRGVQFARNLGRAKLPSLPYTLFCDGDVGWRGGALDRLVSALEAAGPSVGYAYSDYRRAGALNEVHRAGWFSARRLREDNFISTMSLCRTEALPSPAFVEDEERFQDWSLWLRMLNAGWRGTWVPRRSSPRATGRATSAREA